MCQIGKRYSKLGFMTRIHHDVGGDASLGGNHHFEEMAIIGGTSVV